MSQDSFAHGRATAALRPVAYYNSEKGGMSLFVVNRSDTEGLDFVVEAAVGKRPGTQSPNWREVEEVQAGTVAPAESVTVRDVADEEDFRQYRALVRGDGKFVVAFGAEEPGVSETGAEDGPPAGASVPLVGPTVEMLTQEGFSTALVNFRPDIVGGSFRLSHPNVADLVVDLDGDWPTEDAALYAWAQSISPTPAFVNASIYIGGQEGTPYLSQHTYLLLHPGGVHGASLAYHDITVEDIDLRFTNRNPALVLQQSDGLGTPHIVRVWAPEGVRDGVVVSTVQTPSDPFETQPPMLDINLQPVTIVDQFGSFTPFPRTATGAEVQAHLDANWGDNTWGSVEGAAGGPWTFTFSADEELAGWGVIPQIFSMEAVYVPLAP